MLKRSESWIDEGRPASRDKVDAANEAIGRIVQSVAEHQPWRNRPRAARFFFDVLRVILDLTVGEDRDAQGRKIPAAPKLPPPTDDGAKA